MLKVVVVEDEELVRKGIVLTVDWAGAGCAVVARRGWRSSAATART